MVCEIFLRRYEKLSKINFDALKIQTSGVSLFVAEFSQTILLNQPIRQRRQ